MKNIPELLEAVNKAEWIEYPEFGRNMRKANNPDEWINEMISSDRSMMESLGYKFENNKI